MLRSSVLTTARLAGQVERYHTWPVQRRQSVGEHTWQVMRIWWQLFGPMPENVSTYLLWHDAGELAVGDLPFPVKAQSRPLKTMMDRLEAEAVEGMGGPVTGTPALGEDDVLRCKVCDLLEMWEFGHHELDRGNKYAQPIVDDTSTAVTAFIQQLLVADRQRVREYMKQVMERS